MKAGARYEGVLRPPFLAAFVGVLASGILLAGRLFNGVL